MEWQEGCGLGQTIFMGTPPCVVTNGFPLFVARDILSRYVFFRWDSYNGKMSHKIILGIFHSILDK